MVIMKNIFKVLLAIASIVLVAACGGGGGFSGTPNGPSATLRVFPQSSLRRFLWVTVTPLSKYKGGALPML